MIPNKEGLSGDRNVQSLVSGPAALLTKGCLSLGIFPMPSGALSCLDLSLSLHPTPEPYPKPDLLNTS